MEDLEPELVIIEEHVNCRKSNEIQFILSKQYIPYRKVTLRVNKLRIGGGWYKTPCIFLANLPMGGIKDLKDFLKHLEEG
tara:strand:- start:80 stop:319 length:240 start_codon:yes stop_codon:yes gene_type:complete